MPLGRRDEPGEAALPHPIGLSVASLGELEAERVRQALKGRLAGDGPFGRKVERKLAAMLGVPRVLLTTSCTHALELALMALEVGPGHEVICPSFTFVSTANAVLRVGARPVFADIEDETLGLDPREVERRLSPRTRAILPVHYAGVAPDMDSLLELSRARGLFVVEDAAQGLGATLHGRPLGALGDAGCFSFHETKNITCGEGGALALRDTALAARAEIIREKGTNRAAFLRGETDKYTWVAEGSSFVLSDVLAALLDAQLDRFEDIQARRAARAARYLSELAEWGQHHGVRLPADPPGRRSNHHLFALLFPSEGLRDRCLTSLRAEGIQAAFHYVPLHSSPFARQQGLYAGSLPVTERVAATLLRLPLHPSLSDEDVDRVLEAVRRSLD
jgi:dTDP-4-amino-4,6-dideoxygalactose transaminase